MRDVESLFAALAKSAFRSRFHLQAKDMAYLQNKGQAVILEHAADFVQKRLAAAQPLNDGKQTPFKGHPVFVAQHATACCCRGCLAKWHCIPQGAALSAEQQAYIVRILQIWLEKQQN